MNLTLPSSLENPVKPVLQHIVDKLIMPLVGVASRNNNSIINEVPAHLRIGNNEGVVASVIDGLLRSVVFNAKESCIRITAQVLYENFMLISVKDTNSFNTYGIACSLQDVVPLAHKLGGELDIMDQRQRITTITFRFPLEKINSGL